MSKKVEMKILQEGLTYEQARCELEENGAIITRPQWLGYHFRYFDNYCIRLANGEVIVNPKDTYDKDADNWIVIDVDEEEVSYVFEKLKKKNLEVDKKLEKLYMDCCLIEDEE